MEDVVKKLYKLKDDLEQYVTEIEQDIIYEFEKEKYLDSYSLNIIIDYIIAEIIENKQEINKKIANIKEVKDTIN